MIKHPGMFGIKRKARVDVRWRGLDKDNENKIGQCNPCQVLGCKGIEYKLTPCQNTGKVWTRSRVNFSNN